MTLRTLVIATAMSLLSATAAANNGYQQELLRLDADAQAFVQAPGFVSVDPESLTDERYYSSANFPGEQTSVFLPDTVLDAISRSVLLLDAYEGQLPHVRYLIRYSMNVSADFHEALHDYVEITRLNLGPARRADVLEYVSAEHVAPPSEFGVGPHVTWRFAMAPVMGMRAGLNYASRTEVPAAQAQNMDCLGEPCLSLADAEGPGFSWNPVPPPELDRPLYVDKSQLGSTRSVRIVEELWESMMSNGMDPLPYRPDQPHFVFVVSVDVVGQDASALGLAQQTMVLDGSIKEIWSRRTEAGPTSVEFATMAVPRR